MSALLHDIVVEEGETFVLPMVYKPDGEVADLTGYTARVAARVALDADPTLFDFTQAETEQGTIELGGAAGTVVLTLNPVTTSLICSTLTGYGWWDLFLYSAANVPDKLVKGRVIPSRSATR